MSSHNLPHILAELQLLQSCSLRDWDRLLPWARRVGVVGKFYTYLEAQGQLDRIPPYHLSVPHHGANPVEGG